MTTGNWQLATGKGDGMAQNETLIEIEDLTKVFYTDEVETHALSGIHLTVSLRQIHSAFHPGPA